MTRPVIIGAGHNGLVTAFYLARAGLRPLVIERKPFVGGAAVTRELHPGYHVSALAHGCGPLRADVAADMGLAAHGVVLVQPEVASLTPRPGGGALVTWRDAWQTARGLAAASATDAAHYADFQRTLRDLGALIGELSADPPPSIDSPSPGEIWRLLKAGRRFRALGRKDALRLLRWGPMAVADLVTDYFTDETLRATVATRGIFGTNLGVRSAGTTATLLIDAARDPESPGAPCFVRGGLGALTAAMAAAARQAGAEIRLGADVSHVDVDDTGAKAVVLRDGEVIPASTVISNADPKRTLLGLVDPMRLDPSVLLRLRNYRARGTLAKVNLALGALPGFKATRGLPDGLDAARALGGRVLIAPSLDYLEQAFDASKYGAWSERPYLECVLPSLHDPSLAPAGRHVMSVYVQYAPYTLRGRDWTSAREALQRTVLDTLAEYAPNLPALVEAAETITPLDLEREHGYTGGHVQHGEMALDQLYVMRPLLGWAQHRTMVNGLYLCGAGTHPGGGITGANGANAAKVVIADLKRQRA